MSVMAHTSKRDKYSGRILNQLGLILRRDFNDSRLRRVSLTKVELNRDGSISKVYWDTFDDSNRTELERALKRAVGRMRKLLGHALQVRMVPALRFCYDNQFEEEQKMVQLLGQGQSSHLNEKPWAK